MTSRHAEDRFRDLFVATFDDLTRFVRRRITDGDDVVAQTYLVAWRSWDAVPHVQREARAWLFSVARNLMANRRRRDAKFVAWEPQDSSGPDQIAVAEARMDLSRAFAALDPDDQEAIALTSWEGLSAAEAATIVGVSAATFRVRLHRARRRLRTAIAVVPTEPHLSGRRNDDVVR